jgi:autotransporter-associated beta strand protein
MRIKLNPFLAVAPLLMTMTVCMAAPIFSWETDTEGWVAAGALDSVATSTTGATDGLQSLAVTLPMSGQDVNIWWRVGSTIDLTPAQLQAIFTNATELKVDVSYPNPGYNSWWGDHHLEIIIQGQNLGWSPLASRVVAVGGAPQTLTFPLTVAQAASMASSNSGQILLRFDYGNGGSTSPQGVFHLDNFTNTVVADPPPVSSLYWKGDVDNSWTSLNWTSDLAGTVAGGALPVDGTAGVAFTVTGATILDTELGANQSVKSVVVTAGSGPISIGGSHNLTVGADGIWLDETAAGLTIDTSGEIVLGENQVWKNKSASSLIVNSVVSGSGSLTKSGAGPVRLGGANTHTGGTVVEQGILALDHANALGGGAASLTLNGGSVDLNGLNVTIGSLTGLAGGAINNTSLTPSILTLNAATDFGYNCQINQTSSDSAVSLVKTGPGTVTSSGGGNFTGPVTINEGLFVANTWVFNVPNWSSFGNAQMGGRTITVNTPGALSFTSNSIFGNASADTSLLPEIVINETTVNSSRYNQIGPVTLNAGVLDESSTDTGNYRGYQFKGRIKVVGSSYSSIGTGSGKGNHLDSNTEFDVGDVTGDATEDLFVSAPLTDQSGDFASAPGGLKKIGAGTMVMSGTNTYTGDTTVAAGVLAVNGFSIVDTNKLVIDGGKVDPSGSTEVVGSLFFGDVQQDSGTWGATDSGADHIDDIHFTGSGVVSVAPVAGYTAWADANGATDQTLDQDHDGDGVKNGIEYFMGQTGSTFTANPAEVSGTVTWPMDDSYIGVYGTDYEVQYSTDLVIWTKVEEGTGDNTVAVTAGTSVVYDIPTGGKSFVRLVVKN